MKPFEVEILEKSIEQKGNMLKGCYDDDLFKSWSGDLQKRFPNGNWKTVNGARVFMNGSKVVAGLDGFNGEIDKFFDGKGKKESKKPVNERSQKEIHEEKQKIANSMPKPINKMTWEEFKPYGVEMQKQSAHSQPDSYYERMAKMEHDWAIKNDKSQYEVSDKQKESPKSEGKGQDATKEEKGEFINKSKTDKFIVIGDYIYKNSDLKDGVDYKEQRGSLVENKESNRHTVKGVEYSGNGKPEDAIKLMETVDSIKLPEKSPQSQMLDLALNDLKIPIPEYKNSVALSGPQSKVPEYWHGGLNNFKEDTREFLSQLPKLNDAVSDKLIESWYYQTVISKIKGHDSPDSMGIFVKDSNVEDAIKYFSKNK